jgi:ribosomal protein L37AE/L43A
MAKVKYDEFNDEMNPFHPCLKCGDTEFSMNWDTGLYQCDSCGESLKAEVEKKSKRVVKRFRGLNDENEVY